MSELMRALSQIYVLEDYIVMFKHRVLKKFHPLLSIKYQMKKVPHSAQISFYKMFCLIY